MPTPLLVKKSQVFKTNFGDDVTLVQCHFNFEHIVFFHISYCGVKAGTLMYKIKYAFECLYFFLLCMLSLFSQTVHIFLDTESYR